MLDSETQKRYVLIGDVRQDPRGNYCLYDEYHEKIGYYAPVENNTYDAWGRRSDGGSALYAASAQIPASRAYGSFFYMA